MKRPKTIAAFASLIAMGTFVVVRMDFGDERTQALFNQSDGRVISGTKFGMSIGNKWSDADEQIRSDFKPAHVLWGARENVDQSRTQVEPYIFPILDGNAEVSYRDKSWRIGVITLDLIDGKVVAISWHYSRLLYIDL